MPFISNHRRRKGFTLLEILLALTILLIGIVGVLALFPVALRNSKASFEDSVAAMIAENVHASLVGSLRRAPVCQQGSSYTADPTRLFYFYCEGAAIAPNGGIDLPDFTAAFWTSYLAIPMPAFPGPGIAANTFYYPPDEKAGLDDFSTLPAVAASRVIPLGRDWVADRAHNIPGPIGATDSYRQYSFNMILIHAGSNLNERLLQVTIRIFRNYTGSVADLPVHEFVCQVAYN